MKKYFVRVLLIVTAIVMTGCSAPTLNAGGATAKAPDPTAYIMPSDVSVKDTLKKILPEKADKRSDLEKINAWVNSTITYISANDARWQLPKEILKEKKGDSEDYAILLCTLFRAYGIPDDSVYAVIAIDHENTGQAFVLVKWNAADWLIAGAQTGALLNSTLAPLDFAQTYTKISFFNDVRVLGDPFFIEQVLRKKIAEQTTPPATSTPAMNNTVATTKSTSNAVQLLEPANNAGNPCNAPISFSWSPWRDTHTYIFELADNAAMVNPVVSRQVTKTGYQYDGAACDKSYYWRVRALFPSISEWSALSILVTKKQSAALPTAQPTALDIQFEGWYVDGKEVNEAKVNKPVVAALTIRAGIAGRYKICIMRDLTGRDDLVVVERIIVSTPLATRWQIPFELPQDIQQKDTQGYYIELFKDGVKVWAMENAYPPRLAARAQ